MNEFVANESLATEDGYGFRHEGSFLTIRPEGPGNKKFSPHGGSGFFNFPGNHHTYHARHGGLRATNMLLADGHVDTHRSRFPNDGENVRMWQPQAP